MKMNDNHTDQHEWSSETWCWIYSMFINFQHSKNNMLMNTDVIKAIILWNSDLENSVEWFLSGWWQKNCQSQLHGPWTVPQGPCVEGWALQIIHSPGGYNCGGYRGALELYWWCSFLICWWILDICTIGTVLSIFVCMKHFILQINFKMLPPEP